MSDTVGGGPGGQLVCELGEVLDSGNDCKWYCCNMKDAKLNELWQQQSRLAFGDLQ